MILALDRQEQCHRNAQDQKNELRSQRWETALIDQLAVFIGNQHATDPGVQPVKREFDFGAR